MSTNTAITKSTSARCWFCVLNHPEKLFGDIEPTVMVEKAASLWMTSDKRACAINFEKSDTDTPHIHMVLFDPNKCRFSTIQKLFPSIHIEPLLGSKKQAFDYIEKIGKYEEKHHTLVVPPRYYGDIQSQQGKRTDLDSIQMMIDEGYTPNQIMDSCFMYRKFEKMIRSAFFSKRMKETPVFRNVTVYWHVGNSGTGKSHSFVSLVEKYGQEHVYIMSDYETGGLDLYCGEEILFMDEFKGNMRFQQLLNFLDGYRIQIHCRYANAYALWNEVHITSIYGPDEVYQFMIDNEGRDRDHDRIQQLLRRLNTIVYHYKEKDEYKTFSIPASEYINYDDLKLRARNGLDSDGFIQIDNDQIPFKED